MCDRVEGSEWLTEYSRWNNGQPFLKVPSETCNRRKITPPSRLNVTIAGRMLHNTAGW